MATCPKPLAWLEQSPAELAAWLAARGQPAYRAEQVQKWVFQKRAGSFDQMSDLPKALRDDLADEAVLFTTSIALHRKAADGTEKLLVELVDRQRVECVLLRDREKRTVCISTQVGCAMGCVFCASGLGGVVRNLTRGEIIEQILHLGRLLDQEERLSHVVVMGMGEPLANLDALVEALEIATGPEGLGIGARRVTVSTVGLPAALDKMAQLNRGYRLAVSLHAPNDGLRNQLVPVSKNIGLLAVFAAADRYFDATGRRVTYEYVLLGGVNDKPEHALELARHLAPRVALVNIIPYNPVEGLPYKIPADQSLAKFVDVLRSAGVEVKVRRRRGNQIDAACGQLRRELDRQEGVPPPPQE
jgi:23S rRNA (adenine2503-C2)-methyltransferase